MEMIRKERKINRLPLPSMIKHTSTVYHKGSKFMVYEDLYPILCSGKNISKEERVSAFPMLNQQC